jgi:hypothetical protein
VIKSDRENATYEARCVSKESRKPMDNLDYGANAVDHVAILVSIVFERQFSFRKYLEDVIRGTALLELVYRRMFDEVYSCLLDIAIECGIEDGLKVSRGRGR